MPLSKTRLLGVKRSFSTRRVNLEHANVLVTSAVPRSGDVLLARVRQLGHHRKLESPCGRRASLWAGDEILVCYADRYAPDQFEAQVPAEIGECDLVAAGGIAGELICKSDRARRPTRIQGIGLVASAEGKVLSTRDFGIETNNKLPVSTRCPVVAVLGSSMNAGKSTAMAAMIAGETRAGRRVGAAKITGTGAGGDLWSYIDAGAAVALDFTDAGYASTCRVGSQAIEQIFRQLVTAISAQDVDIIVVELADGLLFEDTARLANSGVFRQLVDGVVFAAADAMGAAWGDAWLRANHHSILALSGQVTRAPLAVQELQRSCKTPVITPEQMSSGHWLCLDTVQSAAQPDHGKGYVVC